MLKFWLLKSEPGDFAFADLKLRGKRGDAWNGVRNYQARNFMRQMQVGDLALFYHSNCEQPGVAGVMRIKLYEWKRTTLTPSGCTVEDFCRKKHKTDSAESLRLRRENMGWLRSSRSSRRSLNDCASPVCASCGSPNGFSFGARD